MKPKNGKMVGRGFTLVELLVTITIVAVLAGVSLSVSQRVGVQSKLTASMSRVRALGPMIHGYAQDNGGRLPVWRNGDTYWWGQIAGADSLDPERVFKSPGHREFDRERLDATISYGWNASVMGHSAGDESEESYDEVGEQRMVNFSRPEKILVLADGAKENGYGLIEAGGPLPDPERYAGKAAALMLDGSARVMNALMDFKADSEWFTNGESQTGG